MFNENVIKKDETELLDEKHEMAGKQPTRRQGYHLESP
jgi:hypothetical protein